MQSYRTKTLLSLSSLILVCAGTLHARAPIMITYDVQDGCVTEGSIRIDGVEPRNSRIVITKMRQPITWKLDGDQVGTWKITSDNNHPMRMCATDPIHFNQGGVATCRTGGNNDQKPAYTYKLNWTGGNNCTTIGQDPAIIFDEPPLKLPGLLFPILTLLFALTTLFYWNRARASRGA